MYFRLGIQNWYIQHEHVIFNTYYNVNNIYFRRTEIQKIMVNEYVSERYFV